MHITEYFSGMIFHCKKMRNVEVQGFYFTQLYPVPQIHMHRQLKEVLTKKWKIILKEYSWTGLYTWIKFTSLPSKKFSRVLKEIMTDAYTLDLVMIQGSISICLFPFKTICLLQWQHISCHKWAATPQQTSNRPLKLSARSGTWPAS